MLISDLHHLKRIRRCFNKAAATYDEYATVQQIAGKKLIEKIQACVCHTNKIVDLGCGTGYVTEQLANAFYFEQFHAIDIADQLLMVAKKRLSQRGVCVYEADFDSFYDEQSTFSLMFSNMSLHWSRQLRQTFSLLHQQMDRQGTLAFSLPLWNTFVELDCCGKNLFYTEKIILQWLSQIGFTVIHSTTDTMVIPFASPLHAIKAIKALGANLVLKRSSNVLRGKSFLYRLLDKELTLTYCIGYFFARKEGFHDP